MARRRLYAKQTAPAEYEQIDLFSLLEEEQRQADRIAEQVRGYEITVGHVAVQRLRARGADDETIVLLFSLARAARRARQKPPWRPNTGRTGSADSAGGTRGSPPRKSSGSAPTLPAKPRRNLW